MNAQPRFQARRPRLRAGIPILLVALAIAVAAPIARADGAEPSPAEAPRCPVCVIAAPELIDLAGTALLGASAGEAIEHAAQVVDDANAVRTGVRVARHPHAFRHWVRWAKGNMRSGRAIWRTSKGRLGHVYRWLRRSYSLRRLKRRLPGAAVACVVSGTITGIRTGSIRDAAWGCLGGALGTLAAAKAAPASG